MDPTSPLMVQEWASTSGTDSELTSEEDEVARLLDCNDHYSALGLPRYGDVDMASLKREYRKKAMLVHPDKNMGNERAAEAFKKLQNAYEVVLDSIQRKSYDDELKKEELLNYFRRFQNSSQKETRGHGFGSSEGEEEEGLRECRQIACMKQWQVQSEEQVVHQGKEEETRGCQTGTWMRQ
ncbi:unnamed protein product [Brassica oleracea var. botrytis]